MLVIIDIGGILKIPGFTAKIHWDHTVVASGRLGYASGVALGFPAQKALGIGGAFHISGGGDCFRILFRLGQVDGDIHWTVGRLCRPFFIFFYPVRADVIGILAEPVEIIGGDLFVDVKKGAKLIEGRGIRQAMISVSSRSR